LETYSAKCSLRNFYSAALSFWLAL
jgi:hypothetical protein